MTAKRLYKIKVMGAEEMAQHLKAPTALTEDLNSVTRTYNRP